MQVYVSANASLRSALCCPRRPDRHLGKTHPLAFWGPVTSVMSLQIRQGGVGDRSLGLSIEA